MSAVHGAVESFYNKKYQLAHDNASVAVPDGRPIYWVLKLFGYKTDHLPGYMQLKKYVSLLIKIIIQLVFMEAQ